MAKRAKRRVIFPIPVEVPKALALPGTGWAYTINNWKNDDMDRYLSRRHGYDVNGVWNPDSIVYEHFSLENHGRLQEWETARGITRTPHMQGMIVFTRPKTFNEVRMLFPRAYVSRAKQSFRSNWLYINKEVDSMGYGDMKHGMLSWPVLDRED